MSNILQKATLPKCNLPGHLRKAVRTLRNNENIVILPADKGNSTVVMDRTEYERKLEEMLSDNTYKKLDKDPTTKMERKVAKTLKERNRR